MVTGHIERTALRGDLVAIPRQGGSSASIATATRR
jgi:hypothetical protein